MIIHEHVPLASYTTLRVGGEARFFIEVESEEEMRAACLFAREKQLPLIPLGLGSNVLIPDEGIPAVVVRVMAGSIVEEEQRTELQITAGAGVRWDDVVDRASSRGFFGIENLAGIPGSVGGAVVQNIGAYGSELSQVFHSAETLHTETGERRVFSREEAAFGYRTSFFKDRPDYLIVRVTLALARTQGAHTVYPDLALLKEQGVSLATPGEIATVVRGIRAKKFPDLREAGTAGSFFKNPVIREDEATRLAEEFPGLPVYPFGSLKKISLAWILDKVLGLKGFTEGKVGLFERQPLVLVTDEGATARAVDAFARDIEKKVFAATGLVIEREVETLGGHK